jgi:SAM-dependent methyltransferase
VSYKVFLPGSLTALEWSQAVWKFVGGPLATAERDHERLYRVLLERLPREGLIVDAGCGTARLPIYLARLGYRVVGLEIDHAGCVIGKESAPALPLVQADVRRISLRTYSVDAVVSLGVVEHDEAGPLAALCEARRILKPGGLLILTVPYNNFFRRLVVNRLQDYVTWRRRRGGKQLRFAEYRFSKPEMCDLLGRAGFHVVARYPNDGLPPYTVGLWVDYNNLIEHDLHDLAAGPGELFLLPGLAGRTASRLLRWVPWLVCSEVAFIARAV